MSRSFRWGAPLTSPTLFSNGRSVSGGSDEEGSGYSEERSLPRIRLRERVVSLLLPGEKVPFFSEKGDGYEIGNYPSLIYSSEGVLPYPQLSFLFSRDMVQKGFVAVPFCQSNGGLNHVLSNRTNATYLGQVDR